MFAVELAPRVRVNAVLPGPVLLPESLSADERKRAIAGTLVQRAGRPENVAHAVAFLAGERFRHRRLPAGRRRPDHRWQRIRVSSRRHPAPHPLPELAYTLPCRRSHLRRSRRDRRWPIFFTCLVSPNCHNTGDFCENTPRI